jgi:acyl dehydratase
VKPGMTATRSVEVTQASFQKFAEITGDYNPLHFDKQFTVATRFGRLLARGGIATGVLHALVAMDFPRPGRFHEPVVRVS